MINFFTPSFTFYTEWYWWLPMMLIAISGYVQGVGYNLESLSGVPRSHYGKLYAYPAAVRPLCWVAMLIFSGWVSVIASIALMFVTSILFIGNAREHARIILEQMKDKEY
jgi:hypothetical protein